MSLILSRRHVLAGASSLAALDLANAPLKAADLKNVTLRIGDQTGATRSKLQAAERQNRDAQIAWYAGFAKQDRETASALYDEDASYVRVAADQGLVASLQKTYDTWISGGVFKDPLDVDPFVFRRLTGA